LIPNRNLSFRLGGHYFDCSFKNSAVSHALIHKRFLMVPKRLVLLVNATSSGFVWAMISTPSKR